MMNEFIQILGFACLAIIIVDFITHWDRLSALPDKPFRCDMCMTVWLSIIPFIIQFGIIGVLYAAIGGILSNIIYKYI